MMLEIVLDALRSLPAYQGLLKEIDNGGEISDQNLPRSARLFLLAALLKDLYRQILLITDRPDRVFKQLDELKYLVGEDDRIHFPEPEPLFYENASWSSVTRRDRLEALTSLAASHIPGLRKSYKPRIMIASVRAVMTRTLPRRDFVKVSRLIKAGDQKSPESLQRTWVDIGYKGEDIVIAPGYFSRRGGILDVWPPAEKFPVRLDFFGDEIETIRSFDPATQRTFENRTEVLVTPAREILPGWAIGLDFEGKDIGEFYLPLIHPGRSSLLDYLPKETLILLDDLDHIQAAADEIEEQAVKLRQSSIQEELLDEDFPIPYFPWSELEDSLSGFTKLELGFGQNEHESGLGDVFSPGERFAGRLKPFVDNLVDLSVSGVKTILVSRQASRLKELWYESSTYIEEKKTPDFLDGSLGDGFILQLSDSEKLYLLTDSEIFGWERPKPRRRQKEKYIAPEEHYSDLKEGDWVVHIDYGIGRYKGLVKRTVDDVERELLFVEYDGGDQLFVPIHQADRLNRYVGPGGEPPKPTRLGTPEWARVKSKVRESVQEVAHDLLNLYAKRHESKGFAFSPDTSWQKDLEASFPYIETEDQMLAINQVKYDMESERPMDRLLCGDVGYGKTEVALRAAFKAVMDGKQVAILVPTTILAQQHYDTFFQRLSPFPVTVEMLSRFRTSQQQTSILNDLSKGAIDIIIGTHRLIQPDVEFKDLGLVIIDEEQRFGVTHKEYFKKLRTEIDVLTMTATPIPRTLYMALTGARDISTINTPPEERLPIITHIGPYSPRLVRQAILREIERGGQVFFVHNRVRTIRAMQSHLENLVPEAKIGVGHGQMQENELSTVMHQFSSGNLDVLLSTSIIESGLDIPNANTLIVDRGDTFGLAQLYQLRGRVGRSAQKAYAYFFRHRDKAPTPEGQERLETLAENTQLGAGYSIAMRDLEMRGAGDMLGIRQHGYIASVGFHLYTKLLSQAVRELKGKNGFTLPDEQREIFREMIIPVNVDLPLVIGIPIYYISDDDLRLKLYRRLASVLSEQDINQMEEEFSDRFGPLPDEVSNLFYQMRVKLLAEKIGLASVVFENEQIVFRFPPLPEGVEKRDLSPVANLLTGKNAYRLRVVREQWREELLNKLNLIMETCPKN